jgi:hypothetical protein
MTILRTRFACWIPKARNTHTQLVQYSSLLHHNNGCPNAPQCYVIHTMPFLFQGKTDYGFLATGQKDLRTRGFYESITVYKM